VGTERCDTHTEKERKDKHMKDTSSDKALSRRNFLGSSLQVGMLLSLSGMPSLLMAKKANVATKKAEMAQKNTALAKFQVGEKIRIVSNKFPIGHYRTPMYIRGKVGRIERVLDRFLNPEEEGYGENEGPKVQLYLVHFKQTDVWANYSGKKSDELAIEIYEHWLEKLT
jgi:hypothetical protein